MSQELNILQIREYDPSRDYEEVSSWWASHGWKAVPAAILPKLGIIVTQGSESLGAAWLYMDNSVGVCWLEWLVTSPKCKGRTPLKVIKILVDFMRERALSMDYGVMMTTARQPALVRVLEGNHFQKTDDGVTHLVSFLR